MSFLDKTFRKTLLLRPTPEGVLVASNITGIDKLFLNDPDAKGERHALEMNPVRVYRVRGIQNVDKIAIHDYNTTQLKDLYSNSGAMMSEKTLSDLLETSEAAGAKRAGGSGGDFKKDMQMIKIFSLVAALVGVYIAMKK